MILLVVSFVITFLSGHIFGLEKCFVPGECVSSIHLGGKVVENHKDCLNLCKNEEGIKLRKITCFSCIFTNFIISLKIVLGLRFIRREDFANCLKIVKN